MRHADLGIERFGDILLVSRPSSSIFDVTKIEQFADRVVIRRANLEDVFLKLTGRALGDE
jgi:hypothetical protein